MRFTPIKNNKQQDAVTSKLGQDLIKTLVRRCCTALLVLGQKKAIIKRSELTKLIKSATPSKIPPLALKGIINLACGELQNVMGIRVFETDPSKDKLLLVNNRVEFNEYHNYSEEESDELIVLFLIMVAIFTTPDGAATDLELRDAVKTIVDKDDDFKRILESLLKKLYLIQTKHPSQPEVRLISWGPRAYAETHPDNFMEGFMQLVDQGSPDDWPEQKRRIEKLRSIQQSVNMDPET